MLKGIDKLLINHVFPDSRFFRLDQATVNLPYLYAKAGDWVWSDGRGATYCRIGILVASYPGGRRDTTEALKEVREYLEQLNQ